MSREISAHDLGEYRIEREVLAAIRKGCSWDEIDELKVRAMKKKRMKHKKREEQDACSTD